MAKKDRHVSQTPATAWLAQHGIAYTEHPYDYVEHGGTAESARQLGVDEHSVVKTLVMEDDGANPLLVLMHGDRKVSTKDLARQLGVKKVGPCTADDALRHTGYMVGGCSPFGTKKALPVCLEKTILDLPLVYINGGRRGYLVGVHPHDILRVLQPKIVECGRKD